MAISLQINTALKFYDTSKETCVIYVNLNIHMTSITVFGHDQRLYISYTNWAAIKWIESRLFLNMRNIIIFVPRLLIVETAIVLVGEIPM